jgi:hypothetical protein
MSDEKAASLLAAPGAYSLYTCPQLVASAKSLRARKQELEGLMAHADVDAGGRMMSAIGYRPEYLKVSGQLHETERTAREKQCDLSAKPDAGTPAALPPPPAKPAARAR